MREAIVFIHEIAAHLDTLEGHYIPQDLITQSLHLGQQDQVPLAE
jgi:hypothetical protein